MEKNNGKMLEMFYLILGTRLVCLLYNIYLHTNTLLIVLVFLAVTKIKETKIRYLIIGKEEA